MSGKEKEVRIYSIQKHDASTLHYDLRLEKEGKLRSWAIPKTPSWKKKKLAIQTDDHPLDHAFFEGEIEEGHYGAGTVKLWDKGSYREEKWHDDEIVVDISGEKLSGKWVLIRFRPEKDPRNWLFFKKDES